MGRVGYVKAGYRWLQWHIFGAVQTMPEPICNERQKLPAGDFKES